MCSGWLDEMMSISGAVSENDSAAEPDMRYAAALAAAEDMTYDLIEEQEMLRKTAQEKMS